MSQPAGWWRDAFPLGNGQLGAMPYGRICEERILLNHEKLWYNGRVPDLPDVSNLLSQCRDLIQANAFEEADGVYARGLAEKNFNGECAAYHPAADICIKSISQDRFKNYRRYLDMATGETLSKWEWGGQPQTRSCFVSRADNCLVIDMRGEAFEEQKWSVGIEMHDLIDAITAKGERFEPPIAFDVSTENEWIVGLGRYTDPTYQGKEYGIVARVVTLSSGGLSISADNQHIDIQGAEHAMVIAKVFAYEASAPAVERLKGEIKNLSFDYDKLLSRHARLHRPRFESCSIDIADSRNGCSNNESLLLDAYSGSMSAELLQKMVQYGRYLLISSSNSESLPSHLQGIWNGDYEPPWNCFFMVNENLQMNYWQALPGGLDEEVLGVFTFYEQHMDEYRINARKLFGCRGIFIPALTSPETGLATHTGSWIINWISGAGWLCQLFYDYWLFTGNEQFLTQRLLPFMKEVAEFYQDYFTYDEDGQVVISPSVSPENWPKEFCDIAASGAVMHPRLTVNATMDVAIARELLGNLINSAQHYGLYVECLERWECLLNALPEYQINADGAIREWLDQRFSDNYEHRHLSHLYPVFPGFEVKRNSHPELFQAMKRAVEKRSTVGLKDQTGWSLAHMANIKARLGDGDGAIECLETLMQTCVGKNLFTYHNDYRGAGVTNDWFFGHSTPFQIDANMGITAAVFEMLVQSKPGLVKVLPALPSSLPQGSVHGIQTRTGVTVDIQWSQHPFELAVTLLSMRDQTITLQIPYLSPATDKADIVAIDQDEAINLVEVTLVKGKPRNCKWIASRDRVVMAI